MDNDFDNYLRQRFAALGPQFDDADWEDVRRRRARFEDPGKRRLPRRPLALAAALAGAALIATPAVGLPGRVSDLAHDLFGDEAVTEFQRAHPDDHVMPRGFGLAFDGPTVIGRVWSARVSRLEVRFADGTSDQVELGREGRFAYELPVERRADSIVALGHDGTVISSVPIPPRPSLPPRSPGRLSRP